jgi:hypothetical protein
MKFLFGKGVREIRNMIIPEIKERRKRERNRKNEERRERRRDNIEINE